MTGQKQGGIVSFILKDIRVQQGGMTAWWE
jgi:hypothetical protein